MGLFSPEQILAGQVEERHHAALTLIRAQDNMVLMTRLDRVELVDVARLKEAVMIYNHTTTMLRSTTRGNRS